MLRHLPNALCVLRMLLSIPVVWLLVHKQYTLTLWVFAFAAVTDGLDGFLAKRFNWTTELGKALDPLADKILLVTAFITLSWLDIIPLWLAIPVVLRDITITTGAIFYRVLHGPLTDARPTMISKLNTLVQIVYVLVVVAALAIQMPLTSLNVVLATLVMVTTVASGIDYVATYSQLAIRKSRERQQQQS
jgi:cardiolipin synthase (CMP-forming)